jgi:hypothetical protein
MKMYFINKLRVFQFLALFLIWQPLLVVGQGSILIVHSGATDPASEGFTLSEIQPASVGPVIGDFGMDAWYTYADQSTNNPNAFAAYNRSLTSQQISDIVGLNWALTVTARSVESGSTGYVYLYTGSELFELIFLNTISGDLLTQVNGANNGPFVTLTGAGDIYHNYQLFYDPATDTADFWVDGIDEINGITGESIGGYGGLGFDSKGEVNWSLASFEVVPEPSPTWLILLGSGVLIYFRRKRIKIPARV